MRSRRTRASNRAHRRPAPMRVLIAALLAVAATAAGWVAAAGPPDIAYGEARCAHCQMLVREPDHAAALMDGEGLRAFCDMGCLLIYMKNEHPEGAGIEAAYVRDWSTGQWTEVRTAYFAHADLWTPMRFGIFAFRDQEAASAFAQDQGGRLLTRHEATHHAMTIMMERKGHGGHGGGHGDSHGGG